MKRGAGSPEAARLRLAEVAAEHDLDDVAVKRFGQLLDVLVTDSHAPTNVTDPAQVVDVHFADSLSALSLLDELGSASAADVGSGAGFPGIPLAIARPALAMELVEASERSCRFLESIAETLGLGRVSVVNARAEDWGRGAGRERYDAVLMRAVAALPVVLEYGAPLLRDGGALIAWKGRAESDTPVDQVAVELGLDEGRVLETRPYLASRNRRLYLYRRVRPVPEAYPRRAGIARKRPLGGGAE